METINHRTLISHKIAILAKEKKFNWKCSDGYNIDGSKLYLLEELNDGEPSLDNWNDINYYPEKLNVCCVSAPEQYLLQKWLREVHNINVISYPSAHIKEKYIYLIMDNLELIKESDIKYNRYEEALEEGFFYALNLIK